MKYTLALAVICALGTIFEYRFQYNVVLRLSRTSSCPASSTSGAAESDGGRRDRAPARARAGRDPARGCGDARDGAADRARRADRTRAAGASASCTGSRPACCSPRWSRPTARARSWRPICGRAHARLLPPPRAAAPDAARRSPCSWSSTCCHRARSGRSPSSSTRPARRQHRERSHVGLRRDPAGRVVAPRFGRGYGTYDHTSYRILDMELLQQLVEIGVLGLAAYLLMIVVGDRGRARPDPVAKIRSRRRSRLAVAAAAVAFLVLSTLFDSMSFPHCPYIFLCMAALLAVMVRSPDERRGSEGVRWQPSESSDAPRRRRTPVDGRGRARGCRRRARGDRPAAGRRGAVSQHVTALGETRVFVEHAGAAGDRSSRRRAHDRSGTSRCSRTSWPKKPASRRSRARPVYPRGDLIVLRPAMTAPAERGQLGERIAGGAGRAALQPDRDSVGRAPDRLADARAPDGRPRRGSPRRALRCSRRSPQTRDRPRRAGWEVESLEPVTVTEELTAGGRSGLIAIAVALVTFILWCSGVVIAGALVRAWRRPAPVAQGTAG